MEAGQWLFHRFKVISDGCTSTQQWRSPWLIWLTFVDAYGTFLVRKRRTARAESKGRRSSETSPLFAGHRGLHPRHCGESISVTLKIC